jgi:hypothetical protein
MESISIEVDNTVDPPKPNLPQRFVRRAKMGCILLDPKLYSKVPTKQTGKHSVTAKCDRVLMT